MAYRARTSFKMGNRRVVHVGELIATNDRDVKFLLKQGLIVDIDDYLVEQATARPGEKRVVKKPKKAS